MGIIHHLETKNSISLGPRARSEQKYAFREDLVRVYKESKHFVETKLAPDGGAQGGRAQLFAGRGLI